MSWRSSRRGETGFIVGARKQIVVGYRVVVVQIVMARIIRSVCVAGEGGGVVS